MLTKLAISGYRSLRDIKLGLDRVTLVTGANGVGKSNLYKALRMLCDVAQGRIIRSLAYEGGLSATFWAGPETISSAVRRGEHPVQGTVRKGPMSLKLGFASEDMGYAIDLGFPPPHSPFSLDPEIKTEVVWHGQTLTKSGIIAERHGPHVEARDGTGKLHSILTTLPTVDSMMTFCADAKEGADLLQLRERMRAWRFYDQFRSDRDAPARKPHVGTFTPMLADDGSDIAAAIATILAVGDSNTMHEAIDDAFPKASVSVGGSDGMFELIMHQHGMLRPLLAAELSDGTLRYILWVAALLTPRPPDVMVLNEPETSLHTDLIAPLARLIAAASKNMQVIVISHNQIMIETLSQLKDVKHIALKKDFGETLAVDNDDDVSWTWPTR
jgi:predicted ATPase